MSNEKTSKIKNNKGLTVDFLKNGLVESVDVAPIRVSLKKANLFGKMGANLYLRKKTKPYQYKALLGPESNCRFAVEKNVFISIGSWDNLDYTCKLHLSEKSDSLRWCVEIVNTSGSRVELDLIYEQDVGLAPVTSGRINEYYVSQYLERRILHDKKHGSVICCRQNMKGPTGNPWVMMVSKHSAIAASVDGMQFYGNTFRETGIIEGLCADELAGEYSGELSILALQEKPFKLTANESHLSAFVLTYLSDHPDATSEQDLKRLPVLMQEFDHHDFSKTVENHLIPEENLFHTSPLLSVEELSTEELDRYFGAKKRHAETQNGQLLSFFCKNNNHVVLRAKEALVDRPHAHIMQTKVGTIPDENMMTTTSYMYGVFNSHIAQGNTDFNRLLSVCSSQFNLERQTGQRIFVEIEDQLYLLGVPSAFEIGLNHCRWIYKQGNTCFQVRTWTSKTDCQIHIDFKVLQGDRVNLMVTNQFDEENGWTFSPGETVGEVVCKPKFDSLIADKFPQAQFRIFVDSNGDNRICGDGALYNDGKCHGDSFVVIDINKATDFHISFVGEVLFKTVAIPINDADKQWETDCQDAQRIWQEFCSDLSLKGNQEDWAAIQEILPWYGANALTHFLTPHGLEQFGGAAWGTRDVTQGPFELLLAMRKFDEAKQILRIIFSNQNTDGGWPQWWMFDSYSGVRADSSHGDIYYWCMIALSRYIKATRDVEFLDEMLPYYHADGIEVVEKTPLSEHVDRVINQVTDSFIPGTFLVPFGGGDWNDSMQPVSLALAQRLISSWTVELNYQAFSTYQTVCEHIGRCEEATRLKVVCQQIKRDFNKYLIKNETVSGLGLLEQDGRISLLLHPSDNKTKIHYRLLPMIRGIISGIFTPKQAQHHLALIEEHLKGPDGARLMNRPPQYHGGIQRFFQRAESSPFFGREIGMMYTHAHLRYAEAQARTGHADAFLKALRQAIPIAYRDIVPCGDVRQANCYYSSSDVIFRNRYEADEKYEDIKAGKITLKGGWRIYSSGPGIYIGLVVSRLLGLRDSYGSTIIDPVIPRHLNGMSASMNLMDCHVTFTYEVKENCAGPKSIRINNKIAEFTREENPYRLGGALIPTDKLLTMMNKEKNRIHVQL
ncbi:hypothetical protein HQ585_05005 [candidate division KSB1 bacterium]|nr:hypothetical protein [candidate division KSB1 bacterium]